MESHYAKRGSLSLRGELLEILLNTAIDIAALETIYLLTLKTSI